jgi:ribose transport system substrate-binding protein
MKLITRYRLLAVTAAGLAAVVVGCGSTNGSSGGGAQTSSVQAATSSAPASSAGSAVGTSSSAISSGGAGSGSAGTTAAGKPKTILYDGSLGNDYGAQTAQGVKDAAEKAGFTVVQQDPKGDPRAQYAQLQDAIATGQYAGVVILPVDSVGVAPIVKNAIAAGMFIAHTDYTLGDDVTNPDPILQLPGLAGAAYDSYHQRGTQLAKAYVAACANLNPCKVAFLQGFASLPWQQQVTKVLKDELAQHSNISLVAVQQTQSYAAAASAAVAANVLTAHPDLNVLGAISDPISHGWEIAAKNAGIDKKVAIIGIGGSKYAVQAIRDGRWFATVLSLPYDEGKIAAEAVIKAIQAGSVPSDAKAVSASVQSGLPLLLTKETLPADFQGQWDA